MKRVGIVSLVGGKAVVIKSETPSLSYPHIPLGRRDHWGNWKAYTPEERRGLHLKAERAATKAAKPAKGKTGKPVTPTRNFREAMTHIAESQIGTEKAESFPDMPVEYRTVLRGGKWVQVGSDNLSAFIENR